MAYLGLVSPGFTHAELLYSQMYKNENNASLQSPILTKQQIIDAFDAGVLAGATHMLLIWDTYDFEDSYQFVVYNYPGEDVNDLIKYYDAPGFYRVSAVLPLQDIDEQLSDKRWYRDYP